MSILGALLGGNSSSSNTLNEVLNSISENLTNICTNIVNSATSVCSTNQNLSIDFSGSTIGQYCNVNVNQTSNLNCNMNSIFNTDSSTNITSLINEAISQAASSSNATVQDLLNMSTSNSSNAENVATYLQSKISNNISTNITSSCLNNAQVTQNQTINFSDVVYNCAPPAETVDFSQNAQIVVLVSCVMSQVNNLVSNDQTLLSLAQQADEQNSTTQKGLGDLISSILGFFSSMEGLVVLVVIVVIIVGAWLASKFLSGGGSIKVGNPSSSSSLPSVTPPSE